MESLQHFMPPSIHSSHCRYGEFLNANQKSFKMAIGFVHLLLQCIGELYFFCSWKECNFSWRSRGTIYLEAIITFQPFQGLFKPHVLQHIFRNSLVYGKLVFLLPQKLLVIFVFIIFTVNQFLQDHNKINEKKKKHLKSCHFNKLYHFHF